MAYMMDKSDILNPSLNNRHPMRQQSESSLQILDPNSRPPQLKQRINCKASMYCRFLDRKGLCGRRMSSQQKSIVGITSLVPPAEKEQQCLLLWSIKLLHKETPRARVHQQWTTKEENPKQYSKW